jgi:hypothetical protein
MLALFALRPTSLAIDRQDDGDRESPGAGEESEGVFHIVEHGMQPVRTNGVAAD